MNIYIIIITVIVMLILVVVYTKKYRGGKGLYDINKPLTTPTTSQKGCGMGIIC